MSRATWDDLKRLRMGGQRPKLPVVVTDRPRDAWGVFDQPVLVVCHEPGTPFPVALLAGLDVILMLECPEASRVARLMRLRDIRPARCQSWCACLKQLTVTPETQCEDIREVLYGT